MTAVIILLKYPELGKVKTRLAKGVGPGRALEIYEALLTYTLKEIATLDKEKFAPIAYCDPFRPQKDYEALLRTFPGRVSMQQGGELGERMAAAALKELGRQEKILIIGTDCPEIKAEHLAQADRFLSGKACDLVVGPSQDGGYYLIGMNRYVGELFEDMPWSTDQVLALTLEKAKARRLKWETLDTLRDIDTVEDLTKSGFVT